MLVKTIENRYGVERKVKRITDTQIAIDVSDSYFTRAGTFVDPDDELITRQYIDFEGGPMICESEELTYLGLKDEYIKSMEMKDGFVFINY